MNCGALCRNRQRIDAVTKRAVLIQVYPSLESLQFLKYFQYPRYNNYVLAKYLSTMAVGEHYDYIS